jgi:REP element-mobilizing transposase RayT
MKNRRRKLRQGAYYRVSYKVNRGEIIFDNDFTINLFQDTLKRCMKKYSFSYKKISFTGDQVQFTLFPQKNASLPKIMQWLASVFAKKYNKLKGISGRLWKERYFSRIIEATEEFFETFERILQHPIIANLVKNALNYRLGGLYHYLHDIAEILEHRSRFILALYERHLAF